MICDPCARLADREKAIREGRRPAHGSNVFQSHTRTAKGVLKCVGDGCTCQHGKQPTPIVKE